MKHEWSDILLSVNTWGSVWWYILLLQNEILDFNNVFQRQIITYKGEEKLILYVIGHESTTWEDGYEV